MAHEKVGIAVGQDIQYLNGAAGSGNFTAKFMANAENSIRAFGGSVSTLRARPTGEGMAAFDTSLHEAKSKQATLLLAMTVTASEEEIQSTYLDAHQGSLHTVHVSMHATVLDTASKDTLAEVELPTRHYAVNSINMAVQQFDPVDEENLLAGLLEEACNQIKMLGGRAPAAAPVVDKPRQNTVAAGGVSLESKKEAFIFIQKYADDYCNKPPLEGRASAGEVSAELDVGGLVKRLLNVGVGVAGKYQQSQYQGLLQQDLITALKQQGDCKMTILKVLGDSLLGSAAK